MKTFKRIVVPTMPVTPAQTDEPDAATTMARLAAEAFAPAPVAAPAPAPGHTPKLSAEFVFAGRALFTVSNPKGEHYTYRIRGRESEYPVGSGKYSMSYFLSVKCSGAQWPYLYVGIVKRDGTIKCTGKSHFTPGTKEYDVAAWALRTVLSGKRVPDGYEIAHAGKCGRCGRTLTDPVSIERGIGPECWSQMGH
jgi:hypothetical protein